MTNPTERAKRSKRRSRGWSDDMDSQAISQRLAIVEELHAAWLALRNARTIPSQQVFPTRNRRNDLEIRSHDQIS